MFKIIVARDLNRGIGMNKDLPWKIREDMNHFKNLTTKTKNKNKQNCVIMGRKTYESIPKKYFPLKNRINIILSKTIKNIEKAIVLNSVDNVLDYVNKNKKHIEASYIIGGQNIYIEFLNRKVVSEIFETEIESEYKCDRFLPTFEKNYNLINIISGTVKDLNNNKNVVIKFNHYICENKEEKNYLELMNRILKEGLDKGDRTGTGTLSLFGQMLKYDIRDGKLPLLTTKLVPFRLIVEELLWFLKGSTDARELQEKRVRIWDGNTTREFLDNRGLNHMPVGDIGAGYSHQLRYFNAEYKTCEEDYEGKGVDQLKYVIDLLKNNPTSRRILFSYWNPSQLKDTALPPCHLLYQFYVNPKENEISCCLYQRSSDYFLANNYNAVSAIVLTTILGKISGYKPAEFTHFIADTHIYKNHIEQCNEQLKRIPSMQPRFRLNKEIKTIKDIENIKYKDFKLINYYPQKAIKGKMN